MDDTQMLDQRAAVRRRTFLGARLSVQKLSDWSVSCSVKNLSGSGAMIALPGNVTIPNVFAIDMVRSGETMRAELIWHRDDQAGVVFSGPQPFVSTAGQSILASTSDTIVAAEIVRRKGSRRKASRPVSTDRRQGYEDVKSAPLSV